MNKIRIIVQREYLSRVRKKSFIIITLLAPVGFLILMLSSVFISSYSGGKKVVAVVDKSNLFKDQHFADSEDHSIYFKYLSSTDTVAKVGKGAPYDAMLLIPDNFDLSNPSKIQVQYLSKDRPGFTTRSFIDKTISDAVWKIRFSKSNMDKELLDDMTKKVKINYELTDSGKEKDGFAEAAAVLGYLMGFAIYISLFVYGTMIMKGVMEEKTNRIVEVLASSVKPFQLMMGKIIGLGAVGLTQFLLWIILMTITNIGVGLFFGIAVGHQPSVSAAHMNGQDFDADQIQVIITNLSEIHFLPIAISFVFFFLGGFFFYGALFAAIGSASGEDGDLQSLTFPVSVPIIISIILMMNALNNPDGKLAFWASIIPFSSPIVMPALMPFNPPWWQVLLSGVLLIAGFIFTTYLASKVYRTGILMYGKKVTVREMLRWVVAKQ